MFRMRPNRSYSWWLATLLATFALIGLADGQALAAKDYPTKPIKFIIPFGAGGSADIEGRLIAKALGRILGGTVVPINKTGAGGAITYTFVKNAKPDGYTLAWNSTSILTTTNIGNVPYRYSALEQVARTHIIDQPLVVRADAPWKTFQELVSWAKENPGKLKIGNAGTGSSTHITALAIDKDAGLKAVHVPLGIKRRNAALLAGEVDAIVAPLTGVYSIVKGKKARLVVFPSGKRNPIFPDVPTMKDLGYPTVVELFRGVSVTKGTPMSIVRKLERALEKAVEDPAFVKLSKQRGFRIEYQNREQFLKFLEENDRFIAQILKEAGLIKK